jgi:hypothetical protein
MTGIVIVCWLLGVAALWSRLLAVRRDAFEVLSPVSIVVAGFVWIYGVGYWTLDPMTKASYLAYEGYVKVAILAVLSGGAFWFASSRVTPRIIQRTEDAPRSMSTLGVWLVVGGGLGWWHFLSLSGGFFEYYGALHGQTGAWKETTAYVYGTIYLLFGGALVLVWVYSRGKLTLWGGGVLAVVLAFLLFDAWITGSRGHVLRLALLTCVYIAFWSRGVRRSRLAVGALLSVLPVVFVVLPFFRSSSFIGAETSLSDAFALAIDAVAGKSEAGPGHEVVFAAGLVEAASIEGAFDFGYLWLHPIVNMVPRAWWPEKPYVAEFSIDEFLLVWRALGWIPPDGAAPTGLADAFVRFWWLSPLAWAGFGSVGGHLFKRARSRKDVRSVSYFFCYLVGLIYMLTQGFNAAVYAAMFMAVPLWIGFGLWRLLSRYCRSRNPISGRPVRLA